MPTTAKTKAYVFGDDFDANRVKAFIDKLLMHRIKVYELDGNMNLGGDAFTKGKAYIVPTSQPQYRMVQSVFETYGAYSDSVFYDASAWSLANFYNMTYAPVTSSIKLGSEIKSLDGLIDVTPVTKSDYAYLMPWDDYNAPAALYYLLDHGVQVSSAFKPFTISANGQPTNFGYGTLLFHIQKQSVSSDSLYNLLNKVSQKFLVQPVSVSTGFSISGIDLGSSNFRPIKKPKALMLIGNGVSSYEAGEIWHLLDTRIHMPITKLKTEQFGGRNLDGYNTIVLVSGSYSSLDSSDVAKIKTWVGKGNTLITSREASAWAIKKKLVKEALVEHDKEEEEEEKKQETEAVTREPYVNASNDYGQSRVGGAIFEVNIDITHPLAFGYHQTSIPVYRNSNVWLMPSKNKYSTVAAYTSNPHIDGFISKKNLDENLKGSASLIVSPVGKGRVVMFADNPNFRSSWYGTNRLFLNALMLGNHIQVPRQEE